jgi:hypothetical protein
MPNKKKIRALCENECGRRIKMWSSRFCSCKCQGQYRRKERFTRFMAGKLITQYKLPEVVRQYLIDKHHGACSRCGWSERNPVTQRVPLEIEHIDGDWRNSTEENLTVLCPNCHSLTPTFRSLNRGRGRPGRPGLIGSRRATTGDQIENKSRRWDSNPREPDYKSGALARLSYVGAQQQFAF